MLLLAAVVVCFEGSLLPPNMRRPDSHCRIPPGGPAPRSSPPFRGPGNLCEMVKGQTMGSSPGAGGGCRNYACLEQVVICLGRQVPVRV